MARLLLILAGTGVLVFAVGFSRFPRPQGPRVEALPGVVGVETGGSMAWILRTPNGAALIDAGLDPEAKAIREELSRQGLSPQDVHTVLVTHSHFDHWGGAAAFPGARVVVGNGDAAVVRGQARPARWLVRTFQRLAAHAPSPGTVEELDGDGELEVDGVVLRAVHVPGHTPGSVMFLHGPLLFTGDSLVGSGKGLAPPPFLLSDDPDENLRALQKVLALPFTLVADGHSGVVADARQKLEKALR